MPDYESDFDRAALEFAQLLEESEIEALKAKYAPAPLPAEPKAPEECDGFFPGNGIPNEPEACGITLSRNLEDGTFMLRYCHPTGTFHRPGFLTPDAAWEYAEKHFGIVRPEWANSFSWGD